MSADRDPTLPHGTVDECTTATARLARMSCRQIPVSPTSSVFPAARDLSTTMPQDLLAIYPWLAAGYATYTAQKDFYATRAFHDALRDIDRRVQALYLQHVTPVVEVEFQNTLLAFGAVHKRCTALLDTPDLYVAGQSLNAQCCEIQNLATRHSDELAQRTAEFAIVKAADSAFMDEPPRSIDQWLWNRAAKSCQTMVQATIPECADAAWVRFQYFQRVLDACAAGRDPWAASKAVTGNMATKGECRHLPELKTAHHELISAMIALTPQSTTPNDI